MTDFMIPAAAFDRAAPPARLWWLSFCDPDRPKGSQFLGVALVPADSMEQAWLLASAIGCNPGGEISGFSWAPAELVPKSAVGRLLTKDEALEVDRQAHAAHRARALLAEIDGQNAE